MEYNNCPDAVGNWDERWIYCPVCLVQEDNNGLFIHKDPESELIN